MPIKSSLEGLARLLLNAGPESLSALRDPHYVRALVLSGWHSGDDDIITLFREAGALFPETAQRFHARTPAMEWGMMHLLRRRVIREARPGRYYLDERALERQWPWFAKPD